LKPKEHVFSGSDLRVLYETGRNAHLKYVIYNAKWLMAGNVSRFVMQHAAAEK